MVQDNQRLDNPAPSAHGMSPIWEGRGYRQPAEEGKNGQVEDEMGEEAYQRCFADAARMGRVPNPAFFINSPSAKAYMDKRDRELFTSRRETLDDSGRRRNPNFVPLPKDTFRASRASQSPAQPAAAQTQQPTTPVDRQSTQRSTTAGATTDYFGHNPDQTQRPASRPADMVQRFADPRSFQGQIPPLTLEPHFEPPKPPRMLR